MLTHRRSFVPVLLVLAGALPAFGQVMTPPPQEVPRPDQGIEKRVMPTATTPPPRTEQIAAKQQQPAFTLPTDVNYDVLLEKDEAGNFKTLTEPLYLAALRKNPKIPADTWERINPVLAERKKAIDVVLLGNLDLAEKIDDGIFEKTGSDQKELQGLLQTVRPFMPPSGPDALAKDLFKKNIIDQAQYQVTEQIVRRYTLGRAPAPAPDAPKNKEDSMGKLLQLYKTGIEEYPFRYRELSLKAAGHLSELGSKLGLSGDTATQFASVAQHAKSAATDADRMTAIRELRNVLSLDQRKDLFKAVAEMGN